MRYREICPATMLPIPDRAPAQGTTPSDQGHGANRIISNTRLILACEHRDTRILLLDPDRSWTDPEAIVWEWRPKTDPLVGPERMSWFVNPSDAKRVHGGASILASFCLGAVVLIDVATGRISFCSHAGNNPHSATLLPHGCIATVSSTGSELRLFQTGRDQPSSAVASYHLFDGHGIHWDEKRQYLWALGGQELRCYQFNFAAGKSELQLAQCYKLPEIDINRTDPVFIHGHDLAKTESLDAFYLTDVARIWRFQPDKGTLRPAMELPLLNNIKSISRHPDTDEIIVQQPTESWWSDTLRNTDGTWIRTLPGARFYKARWWVD